MMLSLGLCLLALTAGGCHKKPTQPPPDDKPPMTWPKHMEAAWHPSDTMIVYFTPVPDTNDSFYGYNGLWAIRPDGSNNRPYLVGSNNPVYTNLAEPDWTPNGNWIAFFTGWENDIYEVKFNGDSLIRLTFDGRNIYPTWSPDGRRIAFCKNYNDTLGTILIIENDGSIKRIHHIMQNPVWLDDTTVIASYPSNNTTTLFKININTSDTMRIVTLNNWVEVRSVNISPDRNKIVLQMSPLDHGWSHIGAMNVDGSNFRELTDYASGEMGESPCWSPDGTKIVYTRFGYGGDNNGRLWIMNADGSNKHQLTP